MAPTKNNSNDNANISLLPRRHLQWYSSDYTVIFPSHLSFPFPTPSCPVMFSYLFSLGFKGYILVGLNMAASGVRGLL